MCTINISSEARSYINTNGDTGRCKVICNSMETENWEKTGRFLVEYILNMIQISAINVKCVVLLALATYISAYQMNNYYIISKRLPQYILSQALMLMHE